MNKLSKIVPKGIKYLTQWSEFCLPDHPCIIDKKLTGCGFTEYVLTGNFNSVLMSPRRPLLENKAEQHNPHLINSLGIKEEIPNLREIYYAKSEYSQDLGVDKDLQEKLPKNKESEPEEIEDSKETILKFKENLIEAINSFLVRKKPIKLIVTYDSFRKVKEVLQQDFPWLFDSFYFVVDEFQSIFTDSRFKPSTEIEFMSDIIDLQKISFVSATPMMEEYLDLIDEFKDLPYYELDWESEDSSRVMRPEITAKPCRNINEVAKKIITDFKEGKFQKKTLLNNQGIPIQVAEAKELIFYVNSVKNICDIIRINRLTPEDVNVICASTDKNRKKLRNTFKLVFKELGRNIKEIPKEADIISKVPIPDFETGEINNKPITFCTKTVYLGADFYSTCARSIVLSDSGTECLAVDITLDLPQIVGRQRDDRNPWKNSLEIWFKAGNGVGDITPEEFEKLIEAKKEATEEILNLYEKGTDKEKDRYAKSLLQLVYINNYREDYVSINRHAGSNIIPQRNNLVMVSERRAFDIQQKDYADRFTVFNRIEEVFGSGVVDLSRNIQTLIDKINTYSQFTDKMKAVCNWICSNGDSWIIHIPDPYRTYIQTLGVEYIISKSYRKCYLDEALVNRGMGRIFSKEDLDEVIIEYFKVGERYSKANIKRDLGEIYSKLGISKTAKAVDLEKWFDISPAKVLNPETGKRDMGFEILGIKE